MAEDPLAFLAAAMGPPPTPEETALARAAALKRTRDVEGLRSIGLLGSILGGNAEGMGKSASSQAKELEEQGGELTRAEAQRRDHALSRAMTALNQKNIEEDRKYRRDNPPQFYFPGQGGVTMFPTRGPNAGQGTPVYEPGTQPPPVATTTQIREPGGGPAQVDPSQPPGVQQPGGEPSRRLLKDRPLPPEAVQKMQGYDTETAVAGDLLATFKPEFAADPKEFASGLLAEPKLIGARLMGANAPASGGQYSQDSLEWWQRYRDHIEMSRRHALFGGALSPTENKIFEFARRIRPGADAESIKRALGEVTGLLQKRSSELRSNFDTQHYNPSAAPSGSLGPVASAAPQASAATGDAEGWNDEKEKRYQEMKRRKAAEASAK